MVNHNYEVFKTVLNPYYKYKQDAYKRLSDLVVNLLKESDFFEVTGYPTENLRLTFGNDSSKGVKGAVYVYLYNGSCIMSIEGTKIVSGLDLREYLTSKEHDTMTKVLATLFRAKGDQTIPSFLDSYIVYWEVNDTYCEFISANELRYLNKD